MTLQLYRTYTCLAEELYEEAPSVSIDYLKKAFHMANEGSLIINLLRFAAVKIGRCFIVFNLKTFQAL